MVRTMCFLRTDLQPDLKSTGRFRILCLNLSDFLDPKGCSVKTLQSLAAMIPRFPPSLLEQVVVQPHLPRAFEWEDLPRYVKRYPEMSFYSGFALEDVYKIYGIDSSKGALVIVRPDGYKYYNIRPTDYLNTFQAVYYR